MGRRCLAAVVALVILTGCSARPVQPPQPPPPPLFLTMRGAFGYTLGDTIAAIPGTARARGEQMQCMTREDLTLCTPRIMVSEPGYYTLRIVDGRISAISIWLISWPEVQLDDVEARLDRIAIRRGVGPMTREGQGYIAMWTNDDWTREVTVRCLDRNEPGRCDIDLGIAYSAEILQQRVNAVRDRAAAHGWPP